MSVNARTRRKQQNLDQIIRSGVAGGVAGCVVRIFLACIPAVSLTLDMCAGEDGRRTARQSQDTVPSVQS